MLSSYEFLKTYCGYDKIVSLGSIRNDLLSYYNQSFSLDQIDLMTGQVNQFVEQFWKDNISGTVRYKADEPKTKLITPTGGLYYNIVKIDFNRAFTNYAIQTMSPSTYSRFENYCLNVANMGIPISSKKFLYNYLLTNLIVKQDGIDTLYRLRRTVYDDVFYLASKYGEVIKSEIDGAYVRTTNSNFKRTLGYEVFGKYKIILFKYVYVLDNGKVMVATDYDNNAIIKGVPKLQPNVVKMFLKEFVIKSNDSVIDKFLYADKINILDWCHKTPDGSKVDLWLSTMNISVNSESVKDIQELDGFKTLINKSRYYELVEPYVKQIFEFKFG